MKKNYVLKLIIGSYRTNEQPRFEICGWGLVAEWMGLSVQNSFTRDNKKRIGGNEAVAIYCSSFLSVVETTMYENPHGWLHIMS